MSAKKKAAAPKKQQVRNFPCAVWVTQEAHDAMTSAAELSQFMGHGTAASHALIEWAEKVKKKTKN